MVTTFARSSSSPRPAMSRSLVRRFGALDALHDQERQAVGGVEIVDADDVGMLEGSDGGGPHGGSGPRTRGRR